MELIETNNFEEYESFVKNSNKSHFMQSYYWGEVMKNKHFKPRYLVLKDKDVILGSALVLQKNLFKNFCYFYIPRGFITDYSNFDLIKSFTNELRKFARKNKAIFIKIDPDIKLHTLDLDGNVVDGENNLELYKFLKSIGYKHLGFYKTFKGEQPRFTFRLNLDDEWDNIYKNFHPTTRKIFNKKNQYNLDLYIGGENDIDLFYQTMLDTAKRDNLIATPIEYYKNFYSILNKQNMSDLYVVKVKINDLKETYKKRINDINLEIKNLDSEKYKNNNKKENVLNDLKNKLNKTSNELKEIESIDKDELILSSIMTVKYDNKVWTIHGGNSIALRDLNSNYLIYYQIIKDAYDNKAKMIDFFGTSGEANPDKDSSIYGIHNFKKRLGGEYTEFIGEFDYITNKVMYFLYKKLVPIYRKLKK